MAELWVLALDILAFLGFLTAFIVSFRIPREKLGRSTRGFLQAALLIYIFVGLSNILEHSGITAALDPYEGLVEILFPLLFFFFIYSTMLRSEVGLRLISEEAMQRTIDLVEGRFHAFTEHIPAMAFIKDRGGKYIFSNAERDALSDSPPNHMDLLDWSEELKKELKEHDRIALETGKWEGLETIPIRAGENRVFHVIKFSIPQEEGVCLVGGIAIDITERIALMSEKERLAAIVEQLGEGVMVTEPDGTIVFVNRAYEKMTGYSWKELIGQNPRLLNSGRQKKEIYRELWDTVSEGRTWQGSMVNRKKDGSLFHEQATLFPVKDETGVIIQYAAVMRDITHQMELEETLRQSQKLETIGQLVGGIAHDFNNILTAINGYSELAIGALDPGSKVRAHVERVRDAGERAAELTRKLLGFGRKQMIQPKVLDLNESVRSIEKIAPRLIGEDIHLVLNLDETISPIFADPGQMDQVLMNLLVNARDAIDEDADGRERKIVIETSETHLDEAYVNRHVGASTGPHVLLNVTDSGKGIPRDIQLKIFEPFFTTKKPGAGTGLGLSTIYGIVKQNNGSIFVYSEEGQGATFKVYWPVYCVEGLVSEIKAEAGLDNHVVKGAGVVLVVEDEEEVRNFASVVLSEVGYTVMEADSGESALEIMKHYDGPLDLLFTDMVMPGMNGIELALELSKLRPGLKALYASGYSEEVLEQKGLRGVNGSLLLKPYNRGELTRRIHDLLNREDKVK